MKQITFESDRGKARKNRTKHRVTFEEAFTCFFDQYRIDQRDEAHSQNEERWQMLGMSSKGRVLFVVYTDNDHSVRIISARVATPTEREQYEENG